MRLEDDFDVLAPDDIRIAGTRVGIETVLYAYLHRGRTPEQIADSYPSLRLDQVYATILYYLRNRPELDAYLASWLEFGHRMRRDQANDPTVQDFASRLERAGASGERQPVQAASSERD